MIDIPEVPSSNIVGGAQYCARAYYNGRGQTLLHVADTEAEAVGLATQEIRQVIQSWGRNADWKFPNNDLWEVRVWP